MIKHIFFILFFFISLTLKASADCENPPADGSVYSGCSWADNQDLSSTYMPNASLEFINALGSVWDKSMMMNTKFENSQLENSSWLRANLYESSFKFSNLSNSIWDGANLVNSNFEGSMLINASFKGCLMNNINLSGAVIEGAVFDMSNLSGATWTDGTVCLQGSVGECKK